MKKIKKFLRKLKNDAGSSIVMVVVAIAFIGIVVGALLAAAVQSYRLKLAELNSKDNFYYIEQALNEIYAGVGTQTVSDLQDAYVYTVENMVYFDLGKGRYVTQSEENTQKMFIQEFYKRLAVNDFFKSDVDTLADKLESYISNDTVQLDSSRLQVVDYRDNGENVGKIIKNVTLKRTQEYNRSSANGVFTQSITTDIVIGKPDFAVKFDAVNDQDPNIFKYALVADMGVYVDQKTTPLTIAGNIYAASDYYNKNYNESSWSDDVDTDNQKFGESGKYMITDLTKSQTSDDADSNADDSVSDADNQIDLSEYYVHGSVTSKHAETNENKTSPTNEYVNIERLGSADTSADPVQREYYDGESIKSKYSGFYVNGSQVSVMADTVIVPGTIAVMDKGSLSVYGKDGTQTAESEVWTDDVVLDGYSTVSEDTNATTGEVKKKYQGSDAIFKADMYVKDDTELNASGSTLQITGSYYGYGDSTEKDDRKFTPVVNAENFQVSVTDADGKTTTENRGHYNSSSIIVNGEQSTLNLAQTKNIFLAGRTYIELSKDVNTVSGVVNETETGKDGKTTTTEKKTVTDVYAYHPTDYDPEMPAALRKDDNKTSLRDYKMGESISIKSNQAAYIPITSKGIPTLAKDKDGKSLGYYLAELPPALKGSDLFKRYFPDAVFDGNVPCVMQEVSGKKYYYYDFQTAYNQVKAQYTDKTLSGSTGLSYTEWLSTYPSPQYFAAGFISDYSAELEMHRKYVAAKNKRGLKDSVIAEYLVDIGDYEDFDAGNIILPDTDLNDQVSIFSSGAITTKTDTEFSIVRSDDSSVIEKLLTSSGVDDVKSLGDGAINDILWNKDGDTDGTEKTFIDAYQLSDKIQLEYEYMKWNLGHYTGTGDSSNNETEMKYIKDLVNDENFGDASITPINKFLDISKIEDGDEAKRLEPNLTGDAVEEDSNNILDLASKYSVWVSDKDVVVKARNTDNGKVRGIVITKGNVYFDDSATNGVTDFEGAIIAGGKVYVNGNVKTIASSPEICRAVLRECMLTGSEKTNYVLSLFRGYKPTTKDSSDDDDDDVKTINTIDYTDVVSFSNWMKNVE